MGFSANREKAPSYTTRQVAYKNGHTDDARAASFDIPNASYQAHPELLNFGDGAEVGDGEWATVTRRQAASELQPPCGSISTIGPGAQWAGSDKKKS